MFRAYKVLQEILEPLVFRAFVETMVSPGSLEIQGSKETLVSRDFVEILVLRVFLDLLVQLVGRDQKESLEIREHKVLLDRQAALEVRALQDLQDSQVALVHKEAQVVLVPLDRKELWVILVSRVLLDYLDPLGCEGNPELLEQLVYQDSKVSQEVRVVLAFLALLDYQEHLEQLAIKDQQEILDQWVHRVHLGLLVNPVVKDLKASKASEVTLDHLVPKVFRGTQELQDSQGPRV